MKADFDVVLGDLMFALGIPIPIRLVRVGTIVCSTCHWQKVGSTRGKPKSSSSIQFLTKTCKNLESPEFSILVTSTPPCNWQKSFRTNLIEAALVEATGHILSWEELAAKLKEFGLEPHIQEIELKL